MLPCDCMEYYVIAHITPTGPEYPLLSYYGFKTWMEIVQITCGHRIDMSVVLQCVVNAMEMNDIFYYCLSYFGHNQLNGWYVVGHNVQQYPHITTIYTKRQKKCNSI